MSEMGDRGSQRPYDRFPEAEHEGNRDLLRQWKRLAVVELPGSAEDEDVSVKTENVRVMSWGYIKKIRCA